MRWMRRRGIGTRERNVPHAAPKLLCGLSGGTQRSSAKNTSVSAHGKPDRCAVGQHRVERQGRSAAGDHPAEAAVSPNGRGGVVRQFARERRAGPLEIPEDSNASTYP